MDRRIERIRFTPINKGIQSFSVLNCKMLQSLEGLHHLTDLKSIFLSTTALDVDSVLEQRLAASLRVFAFYMGRSRENAQIRAKLDGLGYRECENSE